MESKLEMIAELSRHATSVLADPVYCFGQSIVTRALPGDVGVISGIEDLYYTPATSPVGFDTALRLKEGWTPRSSPRSVPTRPSSSCSTVRTATPPRSRTSTRSSRRRPPTATPSACRSSSSRCGSRWPGESMDDPEVRERRRRSVISSARSFHDVGTDIMKVEFPVLDLTDLDAAHQACADLDEAVDGPWVLLSAGVTFEGFRTQIDVAADHGCSGFMAGRAIWGDAVGRMGAEQRAAGAALAARRLDELAEVLRGRGAPAWAPVPLADAASVVGPTGTALRRHRRLS